MLTPVVCFTCGYPLGDIAPVYNYIRKKRMAARYGSASSEVSPYSAPLDPTLTDNIMKDVLDDLNVAHCCRTRMISAMDLREHY